jgi:hypothetical protein
MRPTIDGLPGELDGWHVWTSDAGTLYATCQGLYGRGSGTTVTAPDADRLRQEISRAEGEADGERRKAAALKERTGR